MKAYTKICAMLAVFCCLSNVFAQESLHLIATITGKDVEHRITGFTKVGDINGDGYVDIMVGDRGGNVKIYFGGAAFDTIPDLKFSGEIFGSAGDVNRDGYDDIMIGAVDPSNGLRKIYLYFGGVDMDTIPDFEFKERYLYETLGTILAGAGDVNGDGFNDFMIGSAYNWYDGIGRVYLFFGGMTVVAKPAITFEGRYTRDFFGAEGIGIGDVNGDGFDDIMIGAPATGIADDSGKVMIYFGGAKMDNIVDITIPGPDINFGTKLANAGDLNGDGIGDFLITSLRNVYLYLGIDSCIVIHAYSMGYGGFVNVGSGGDINNDGFDDFLIGNTNHRNSSGVMVGGARVYFGSATLDTMYDFSMEGEHKWDEFSKYMAIVGDVNGDGYDEVLVGAPNYPDYQNPLGKVYLYSYKSNDKVDSQKNRNRPALFSLNQNYPNPFNSSTKIFYHLESASIVKLQILDCNGELIKTLAIGRQSSGEHSVTWEGRDYTGKHVASGVYFYRIQAGRFTATKKLLLLK